jgi:hypothetical protein
MDVNNDDISRAWDIMISSFFSTKEDRLETNKCPMSMCWLSKKNTSRNNIVKHSKSSET